MAGNLLSKSILRGALEVLDIKNPLKIKGFSFCRRPGSNRYGYFYPRDFKSRASASSATAAYGTYRARTYDPLLVRQMLSQLS